MLYCRSLGFIYFMYSSVYRLRVPISFLLHMYIETNIFHLKYILCHLPLISTCYALILATGHSFSYLLPILVLFVAWVWCWGPGLELGSVDLFCEKSLCESGQVAFLLGKPGGTSYCLPTSQRSLEAKVNHSGIKALRAIKLCTT